MKKTILTMEMCIRDRDRTPGKTFSGKYGGGIRKDSAGPGSFEPYNFITKRFQNKIYYNNYLQK